MGKEKVRIGFVGVGSMGQCAHLKNYAALPAECEVVALAEPRAELAARVAARYSVPHVYCSAEDMLGRESLDGIVAPQPFTRHEVILGQILSAGIPVFIEKPLAGSVDTGKRILKMIQAANARVMLGYHKRSDPATELAKETIDRFKRDRSLGALTYCRVLMPAGDWIAGGFNDLLRTEERAPDTPADPAPEHMSPDRWQQYIAFVNYYIHQVNLMRHLLGEPYEVAYADPSGVLLVGRSRSGVPCTIEMTPYRTTLDWQESALVTFERGYVRLRLPAPLAANRPGSVEIFQDSKDGGPPSTVVPQLPWEHAMRRQARHFLAFVRGEAAAPCGPAEALEDLLLAADYIALQARAQGKKN